MKQSVICRLSDFSRGSSFRVARPSIKFDLPHTTYVRWPEAQNKKISRAITMKASAILKFAICKCPEFIYLTGGHKLIGVGSGSDNRLSVQYPYAPFLSSLQEI